jgi:hypothetical protein
MKRITLLAVFALAGVATMAQGVDFGIHAGWNNAKIDLKQQKVTSHSGYMAGVFARFKSRSLYLEPALNFVHKESAVKSSTAVEEALKYSSVDIPLMIGFRVLNLRIIQARVFAGPEFSVRTSKLKLEQITADLKAGRATWSGKAGAGVDAGNITLDVDYAFGLERLGGDAEKARSFTVTLGFKIF